MEHNSPPNDQQPNEDQPPVLEAQVTFINGPSLQKLFLCRLPTLAHYFFVSGPASWSKSILPPHWRSYNWSHKKLYPGKWHLQKGGDSIIILLVYSALILLFRLKAHCSVHQCGTPCHQRQLPPKKPHSQLMQQLPSLEWWVELANRLANMLALTRRSTDVSSVHVVSVVCKAKVVHTC